MDVIDHRLVTSRKYVMEAFMGQDVNFIAVHCRLASPTRTRELVDVLEGTVFSQF